MDALERLKNDWKNQTNYPKVTKEDIYKLLHKKSSSIVKWIFILSIIEFGFWTIIGFLIKDNEAQQQFDSYEVDHITTPLIVLGYIVLVYFFTLFYRNYKKISNSDSVKTLMQKILTTRTTVRNYVIFNLVFIYISVLIGIWVEMTKNPDVKLAIAQSSESGDLFIFYGTIAVVTVVLMALTTALLLGFYYLVYGILLKRLKQNYKELKTISETDQQS